MVPLVFIFVLVQSALSMPTASVNFYDISQQGKIPDNGQLINRNVTTGAIEYIDGGEMSLYTQILLPPLNDLATLGDGPSQAITTFQTISLMGELAIGIPGDACPAADLINTSVGNRVGLRGALATYLQRFNRYIDVIVRLVLDPNSVRFSAGPRGSCLGGGRTYQFEAAWDRIISQSSNGYQAALLNEEYCACKRLYSAFNVRSNNIAAAITAATLPEVQQVAQITLVPVGNFLRVVANGGNLILAAQSARQAVLRSQAEINI